MKRLLVLTVILTTLLSSWPTAGYCVTVPQGTSVIVKLVDTVSSGTNKQGDKVALVVVTDVVVGGKKVIAAGAPAQGTVVSAAKRFIAGIGGQIELNVTEVKAVDGTVVPLKFSKETHNGSTLVAAVVAVVCCCCAWLIPGKDVSIEKGTIFDSETLSAVEVK